MPFGGLTAKTTGIILSIALVQVPGGLGFQNQKDAEQQRLETCRRLLESIAKSGDAPSLATGLKETSESPRIVDLTNADLNSFISATSKATVDEVLVIDEQRLGDRQFALALAKSPALFTVAATAGAAGIKNILRSPAGQPEIFAAIPTNATGVEKVFGVPASESAPTVKYLTETSDQFRVLKNSHLLNYSLNGRSLADTLVSKAKRHTSEPFIVAAHNEGGTLRLPDGSSVRVDTLYEALGKRPGMVLSCDTINSEKAPANSLLTNRELDFRDIAAGLASAQGLLSSNPDLSLGSFLFAFSKAIPTGDSSLAGTVKVVVIIVGGLIVLGLLYYWVCEDPKTAPAFCAQRSKPVEKKNEGGKNGTAIR